LRTWETTSRISLVGRLTLMRLADALDVEPGTLLAGLSRRDA
jgi:hypothetical protein